MPKTPQLARYLFGLFGSDAPPSRRPALPVSQCRGERLEARVAALERASASPLGPALDRNELAYLMDELEKKLEALDGLPLPEGAPPQQLAQFRAARKEAVKAIQGLMARADSVKVSAAHSRDVARGMH